MSLSLRTHRTADYKPYGAWFSLFALFLTGFLLYAGGFTTSIGAGMVFPDWPLSNGSLNPEGWTENTAMMAEHSHRLIGMVVGLLTLVLFVWLWRRESRLWLRRLGLGAIILVIVQGVVGGARVLFNDLNFAMVHAFLAQTFVCVLVAIAAGLSRSWISPSSSLAVGPAVRRWGIAACALIFLQLVIAAVMRHSFAGLAIPTFPFVPGGGLIPHHWTFGIGIHFAHRAMAVILSVVLIGFAVKVWRDSGAGMRMKLTGAALVGLLALQIYLGASIIWTGRDPQPTTWHVVTGAVLLGTTAYLTFLAHQPLIERSRSAASDSRPASPAPWQEVRA